MRHGDEAVMNDQTLLVLYHLLPALLPSWLHYWFPLTVHSSQISLVICDPSTLPTTTANVWPLSSFRFRKLQLFNHFMTKPLLDQMKTTKSSTVEVFIQKYGMETTAAKRSSFKAAEQAHDVEGLV